MASHASVATPTPSAATGKGSAQQPVRLHPTHKPSPLPLLGRAPRPRKRPPKREQAPTWYQYTKPPELEKASPPKPPLKKEVPRCKPLLPVGVPVIPLQLPPPLQSAFDFIHAPKLVLPTTNMPDVMPPLTSGFGALASFSGLPSVAQVPTRDNDIEVDDFKTESAKHELAVQVVEAQKDSEQGDRESSVIKMPEAKDEAASPEFAEDDKATQTSVRSRGISPEISAAGTAKRERSPEDSDSECGRRVKLKPSPDSPSADSDHRGRLTPQQPPDSPSASPSITPDSKASLPAAAAAGTAASPSATAKMDPRNLNVFFPNYLALAQHHLMVHSKPGSPPEAVPPPPPESLLARLAAAIMVGDYHTAGVLEFQAASLIAAMAAIKAERGTALEDVPSAAAELASFSAAAVSALLPPTVPVESLNSTPSVNDVETGRAFAKEEQGPVISVPYFRDAVISVSSSEDESCCDDEECKCEILPPTDSAGSIDSEPSVDNEVPDFVAAKSEREVVCDLRQRRCR
ncbi:hypothetical protein BDZ88DRAFT_403174 [Geranomyces variabilis]|nr:hypothetical protein BDZ88DRAFT_403174 [Geranomyces variabilis]KAJ3141726.1 hypothetical protein HDU90_006069 [Geranomyces variabilis]